MSMTICTDRHGNTHEIPTQDLQFRVGVYGVIIKDNSVLLSPQWDGYNFPGGGVKQGERMRDALLREVKEETGFQVSVVELIACEDSFYQTMDGKSLQSYQVYFLCTITGGEASIDHLSESEKEYVGMPEWLPIDRVSSVAFYNSADNEVVLRSALEKQKNI